MSGFTALLAFIIVYMPYQSHYAVTLPVPGLNLANLLFLAVVIGIVLRPGKARVPTPLRGHFFFMMAVLTVSFMIGQFYDDSQFVDDLTALKTHIFYMAFYFLYYHAVRDEKEIRILFNALLVCTFIVSLHCIRQGLEFGLGNFDWFKRAAGPFSATAGGANFAAAFFILYLPLFVAVFLYCKSRPILRLLSLPGAALGILGMMYTFSRQAMMVIPVLFLAHSLRRNLGVAVLLVVVLLSYQLWAPAGLIARIEMTTGQGDAAAEAAPPKKSANQEEDDSHVDNSTAARFILWTAASEMFADKPWGIGLAHFGRELKKYASIRQNDPHNIFMRVLAESGVLGIVAILYLLWGLFFLGGKILKVDSSEDARLYGNAFPIATLGMVFANLFGSRFFDGEVSGNFWVLGGLVARYYTLQLEKQRAAPRAESALVPA